MTPVWWLLGFIPALVILYFLKLKRQNVPVSSTLLWKRCLEDLHVNSPFQRLRRSLLFLLQLMILITLILAVWRPRCSTLETPGGNLLVFIDNSASMNAREKGGSRLDLARRDALKLVESMGETDRMMVLTFASRTTTVQPLTSDRALLESSIRSVHPTSLPTDILGALSTAYSLSESLPTAEIYVLGDACYGDLSSLSAEAKRLRFRFQGKTTALDNVAITEADVRRTFGRDPRAEVFSLIQNFSTGKRDLTVSLFHEDQPIDARKLSVAPGESIPVTFDVTGLAAGLVRVEVDGQDSLPDDDRAYLEIAPPRRISVIMVGEENTWLDWAMESNQALDMRRVTPLEFLGESMQAELQEAAGSVVLLFDRWVPERIPELPAIFIACHPPLPGGMKKPRKEETPVIIDYDRSHPVNNLLTYNSSSLRMKESLIFESTENYRTLVDSERGSVIGIITRETEAGGTVPALVIGFDILESNWPVGHYSFPIFFTNAVIWLGTRYSDEKYRWRTGESLVYTPGKDAGGAEDAGKGKFQVRTPDSTRLPAIRERNGAVVFSRSDSVGIYELYHDSRLDSRLESRFGVSLLNKEESNLEPLKNIDFGGYSVPVRADLSEQSRDFWVWFAIAALGIMLIEWFIYHRRVYV